MITDENSSSDNGTVTAADGTLVIIVCRAKHLPNRRKFDKQNPYCALRVGTVAEKTPSDFRGGQTPEWTHEVRFLLTRERKPVLKLDILDETKNDPTPIGSAEVDCTYVFQKNEDGKYIFDQWHDLSLNGRTAGMIYLEMTFYPSAPIVPGKIHPADASPALKIAHNSALPSPERVHHYPDNEPDYYRASTLSDLNKGLPAPPPQNDGVFVSGDYQEKRKSWKPTFLQKQPQVPSPPVHNVETHGDGVFVSASAEETKRSRFHRLADKFNAFEPVTVLRKSPTRGQNNDSVGSSNSNNNQSRSSLELFERPRRSATPQSIPSDTLYNKFTDLADSQSSDDEIPPPPLPKHSVSSDSSKLSPSGKRLTRKAPPSFAVGLSDSMNSLSLKDIPFSADDIGQDKDERDHVLPKKVYLFDKEVSSLRDGNDDEILDSTYYAPTPDEHFSKSMRLQHGNLRDRDLDIDPGSSGYVGAGKWKDRSPPKLNSTYQVDAQFSPSVFDKKPIVPPKIPIGLTEREYYILEKEQFLRDLNGKRA